MKFAPHKTIDVVGVGNALMDLLVEVEDAYVEKLGLEKGYTYFVDAERALMLLEDFETGQITAIPGGAAANTIKGVATLGGKTVLFAAVGDDTYGRIYREAMRTHGVEVKLQEFQAVTGHALTFITPDGQRTFSDHLGATLLLQKEAIDEADIAASKVLHLEAYQLEGATRVVVLQAIAYAKKHDTRISLDLTDALLVERNLEFFQELVKNDIDILFANELEAKAFTGLESISALSMMSQLSDIVVLKRGHQGSLVANENQVIEVPAQAVTVVDTTGAGDMYAAGFLYGLTHGWDLKRSAETGTELAAQIIGLIGVPAEKLDGSQLT